MCICASIPPHTAITEKIPCSVYDSVLCFFSLNSIFQRLLPSVYRDLLQFFLQPLAYFWIVSSFFAIIDKGTVSYTYDVLFSTFAGNLWVRFHGKWISGLKAYASSSCYCTPSVGIGPFLHSPHSVGEGLLPLSLDFCQSRQIGKWSAFSFVFFFLRVLSLLKGVLISILIYIM